LAITWGLLATVAMITLPLWESREGILTVVSNLFSCHRTSSTDKFAEQKGAERDTEMAKPQKIDG